MNATENILPDKLDQAVDSVSYITGVVLLEEPNFGLLESWLVNKLLKKKFTRMDQ